MGLLMLLVGIVLASAGISTTRRELKPPPATATPVHREESTRESWESQDPDGDLSANPVLPPRP